MGAVSYTHLGQGSTGTEIAGNNAVVNQDGTLDVSGGGHGIDTVSYTHLDVYKRQM